MKRKSNKVGTRGSALGTRLGLAALTGLSVMGTVLGRMALKRADRVPPVDALVEGSPLPGGEWPSVSVIVPARNEERNLPRLLPNLLAQRYPNYEVLVVDDQSTDSTPEILAGWSGKSKRLRVVGGAPLPEGWRGKPHAMSQGVKAARGEWLLFTDADTVHTPMSVSSTIAYALRHNVDLLSILPHSELGSPSEKIIMPTAFMGISSLYPPHRVNDPRSKTAIANGQFILIRREVYDAVGGVESVRDCLVEDMEFARIVKGAGHRLYLADGRHLMSVRMYTNLGEIWEGWSKNAVVSFRGKPGMIAIACVAILSVTILPFVLLRWNSRAWQVAKQSGATEDRATALWVSAITAWNLALPFAYRRAVDRVMGVPAAWTLTQPIGTAAMLGILLSSLVRLVSGKGVTWKGRTYSG